MIFNDALCPRTLSGSGIRAKPGTTRAYLLLLLPLDFFSPCWLLRLLLEPPRLALARSPWLRLLLLDWSPRLDALPRPEDDDEDLELREGIAISFTAMEGPPPHACGHSVTLGACRAHVVSAAPCFL